MYENSLLVWQQEFDSSKQHNWSVLKYLTYEFIPVTTISLLQNFIWYSLKFCISICANTDHETVETSAIPILVLIFFLYFCFFAQWWNWRNIIVTSPICYTKSNSDKSSTSGLELSSKNCDQQSWPAQWKLGSKYATNKITQAIKSHSVKLIKSTYFLLMSWSIHKVYLQSPPAH